MGKFLRQLSAVWLALFAMLLSVPAQSQYASDIDIYSGAPRETDLPNVLIILDNTANWKNLFEAERAALKSTFNALPMDKFRVGLMLFTESGETSGGYVRAAIRKVDGGYRDKMIGLIDSLRTQGSGQQTDQGNSPDVGVTMAEAYYYFAGKAPHAGGAKKADHAGNTDGTAESKAIYALPGNALSSRTDTSYDNPFAGECTPNYVIYISNGYANSNDANDAKAMLADAYRELDPNATVPSDIVISPSGSAANVADEWARFMKNSPQQITTFTIDVREAGKSNADKKQAEDWGALLGSMAAQSGGEYFKVNGETDDVGAGVQAALGKIFNQLQAVNSVFASASLPVSVNARGTYLNQVFMGMFRPDQDAKPRWRGNLKQFRFGYDPSTDMLKLVDANGESAINVEGGFIMPTATSYWSHNSSYWANEPMGTPASASDAPDGEVVEKGGVAQGIRETWLTDQTGRKILTCNDCAAGTSLATDAGSNIGAVPASLFGAGTTDAQRAELVAWIRGTNNAGEVGPGGGVTVRPSVHGDVLHSRPAVVNYGGTTGVVVFYGANDGLLRAVNGNQTGSGAGRELWAFVAKEHLPKFKRLRDNSPSIRLSTTLMPASSTAADPKPRDYFADGPIGVYQKVNASGVSEKVYVYSAMRRGGRMIYALDVSNPALPKFLWKKTDADIPVLGQTWSEPRVARLRGHSGPVLVMGAGYDEEAEDQSPPGATSRGNAVLVLDATTGALLKKFDTDRSVAADVSLVDSNYDGYVDRAYAVDLGGNLYRLDFEDDRASEIERPKKWSMYKLAALASDGSTRKFFYPPDVVLTREYSAILLASGDREKPLATTSSDRFFMVRDRRRQQKGPPADLSGYPIRESQLAAMGNAEELAEKQENGCYYAFSTAGEKAVNAPVTAGGVTYFSTNRPQASTEQCRSNLGRATVYSAPLFCQVPKGEELEGGGLPPSPVVGVVTVTYTSQDTGETMSKDVPFIIGAPNEKKSGIEGSKVKPKIVPTRKRKYWYLENAR